MEQHTRREPGCKLCLGNQSQEDPRRFLFYEAARGPGALDAPRCGLLRAMRHQRICASDGNARAAS